LKIDTAGVIKTTEISSSLVTIDNDSDVYDVWIQGGASTSEGDDRNLAVLGLETADLLVINYNNEYKNGTLINSKLSVLDNVSVNGSLDVSSISAGRNISTAGYIYAGGNLTVDGSIYSKGYKVIDSGGGWHRTYNNTGWYNYTHDIGIYATDGNWVRTYGAGQGYYSKCIMLDNDSGGRGRIYWDGSTSTYNNAPACGIGRSNQYYSTVYYVGGPIPRYYTQISDPDGLMLTIAGDWVMKFRKNIIHQNVVDINGAIYQRGTCIHADYVFEKDYKLESIEEHAQFMYNKKHLKAVPKATKDENDLDIVEYGSHMRGMLEELEKAHCYIDQLYMKIKKLEEKLESFEDLEARIIRLENLNK
jgi:hypothetical protein